MPVRSHGSFTVSLDIPATFRLSLHLCLHARLQHRHASREFSPFMTLDFAHGTTTTPDVRSLIQEVGILHKHCSNRPYRMPHATRAPHATKESSLACACMRMRSHEEYMASMLLHLNFTVSARRASSFHEALVITPHLPRRHEFCQNLTTTSTQYRPHLPQDRGT